MARQSVMSFTAGVVAELVPHVPILPCCRAALIEGMRCGGGRPATWDGDPGPAGGGGPAPRPPAAGAPPATALPAPLLTTRRAATARLALAALHADGVPAHLVRVRTPRRPTYRITVAFPAADVPAAAPAGGRPCCDRTLLRGAFLASGAVTRPDAPPHLEIMAASPADADTLTGCLRRLGVAPSVVERRGRPLVLVRTTAGVATVLSTMGASGGRLRFEEGRVVREMRSGVNRRLNTETANLRRTVDAGLRQARAAEAVQRDPEGWARLPPALREAAVLRHRHPHDTLARLAGRAGTSRSAMAGRLRRLLEAAGRRRPAE